MEQPEPQSPVMKAEVAIAKAPFNLFGLETLPRKPFPARMKRGATQHIQRT